MAFISEQEAHPLSEPHGEGVTCDELETTMAAFRHLKPDRRSVVVLRFSADMRHPRFAEAFHHALADLMTQLP